MGRRLALPLVALLAAGCGGQGAADGSSSPGLSVRVVWPTPNARVVPASSASVRVKVTQGGVLVGDATIVRPATTTAFAQLPVGTVTVTATACPNADGTGTAMASATVPATIVANGTATVDLTMASTVNRLVLSPSAINLSLSGLITQQLTVIAYDAANAVILSAPSDYAYGTTNGLLFNVNATGLVQGLAVGTATVSATHRDSGVAATASVRVTL